MKNEIGISEKVYSLVQESNGIGLRDVAGKLNLTQSVSYLILKILVREDLIIQKGLYDNAVWLKK
jgi:predicted transcriptional regulator